MLLLNQFLSSPRITSVLCSLRRQSIQSLQYVVNKPAIFSRRTITSNSVGLTKGIYSGLCRNDSYNIQGMWIRQRCKILAIGYVFCRHKSKNDREHLILELSQSGDKIDGYKDDISGLKITAEMAGSTSPLSYFTDIPPGSRILISRAAIIGYLFVRLFHKQGHKNVTVCDRNKLRLDFIRKMNTGYDLVSPMAVVEKRKENNKYLFDVILETSGRNAAIEYAFTLLAPGGKICLFGDLTPVYPMGMTQYEESLEEISSLCTALNTLSFKQARQHMDLLGLNSITYDRMGVKVLKQEHYQEFINSLRKKFSKNQTLSK